MASIFDLNYLAVIGAAIISVGIGAVWYSSVIFGKTWRKLSGITEKKLQEITKTGFGQYYAISFVTSLVMSFVLAVFVKYSGATTLANGALTGFLVWLGFIVTVLVGEILWENKHVKLYAINIAYYLVSLVIMGAILATWV